MLLNLSNKNFSIMAATGYIMTQAGAAAVANATGWALLATPWGGAALTVGAMLVAEHLSNEVTRLLLIQGFLAAHESKLAITGLMVGLGLATVVAPWAAVAGGFSAMIADRFLSQHRTMNKFANGAALLTPLAPLSALAFVTKGVSAVAAMIPSNVAALVTPANLLIVTGLGSVGVAFSKSINLQNKSLSIMAATGFIMTKVGVAATLAKMTGVALLASPWGAAVLTVAGMVAGNNMVSWLAQGVGRKLGVLCHDVHGTINTGNMLVRAGVKLGLLSRNMWRNEVRHTRLMNEVNFVSKGVLVGLGLATVVAPWVAVVGGFSAMITDRFLAKHRTVSDYVKRAALFTPLAPAAATGLVARGAAAAVAMVPSAVAAWVTPTTTMLFTGAGAVAPTAKETVNTVREKFHI